MVIAIDGPAGAGKSTVARAVAEEIGFTYLDSGAMYRCVALAALEGGTNLDDGEVLGALAEGRDIGTVVSPEAPLKVFLTASAEERARRRAAESGEDLESVLTAQRQRDARDSEREHGALRAAPDAVNLDTTGLTLEEVVAHVVALARGKGLA